MSLPELSIRGLMGYSKKLDEAAAERRARGGCIGCGYQRPVGTEGYCVECDRFRWPSLAFRDNGGKE